MLMLWELCRRSCHRKARWIPAALLCVIGLGLPQSGLGATMFGVTDGGVVEAAGCMAASCGGSQTFDDTIGDFAAVSGSIMIDASAGMLDLSLTLEDPFGLSAISGSDNGVSAIGFTGVLYSVTGLSLISPLGGGHFIIAGGQTASVSGVYSQDAAAQGFALDEARITGTCNVVDQFVTCGIGFGTTNFTLDVGAPLEERYFRHTMNVTGIVPEPSTGLLLAAGLLGLARRRR